MPTTSQAGPPIGSEPTGSDAEELKTELQSDAKDLKDTAKRRAEDEAETRKNQATGAAKSTSAALRTAADDLDADDRAPDWLTAGFQQAADGLADMAQSLEGKSAREIGRQTSRFARDNPAAFLAGSAALGFALARFLRAGAEHDRHETSGQQSFAGTDTTTPRSGFATDADPYEPMARTPTASTAYPTGEIR